MAGLEEPGAGSGVDSQASGQGKRVRAGQATGGRRPGRASRASRRRLRPACSRGCPRPVRGAWLQRYPEQQCLKILTSVSGPGDHWNTWLVLGQWRAQRLLMDTIVLCPAEETAMAQHPEGAGARGTVPALCHPALPTIAQIRHNRQIPPAAGHGPGCSCHGCGANRWDGRWQPENSGAPAPDWPPGADLKECGPAVPRPTSQAGGRIAVWVYVITW